MDVVVDCLKGKKVGVAVSGGMDSMALLHWLIHNSENLGITLTAINFDHNLRETSYQDSLFVMEYCKKHNIPCLFYNLDIDKSQNIENAARQARYEIFRKLLESKQVDYVATAHHAQDNAETVLLHLFRGSGLKGVSGIQYKTPEGIVRPLLYTPKEDIEKYVQENNVPYVVDETNLKPDYDRNFIRLEILPKILQRFPAAVKNINEFSKTAKLDDDFINQFIKPFEAKNGEVFIPLEFLEQPPSIVNRTILESLKTLGAERDIEQKHIERIKSLKQKRSGARLDIKNQIIAVKDYGGITLTRFKQYNLEDFSVGFEPADTKLPTGLVKVQVLDQAPPENFLKNSKDQYIDAEKLPKGCVFRYRRAGDVINKLGGGGKAALKEFFIDKKIPARKRAYIPVLAKDNNVYAILGLTVSEDVKIDPKTQTIYKLTYLEDDNG